jgi:hypothetical protein
MTFYIGDIVRVGSAKSNCSLYWNPDPNARYIIVGMVSYLNGPMMYNLALADDDSKECGYVTNEDMLCKEPPCYSCLWRGVDGYGCTIGTCDDFVAWWSTINGKRWLDRAYGHSAPFQSPHYFVD